MRTVRTKRGALRCREDAAKAGISSQDLEAAAKGNLIGNTLQALDAAEFRQMYRDQLADQEDCGSSTDRGGGKRRAGTRCSVTRRSVAIFLHASCENIRIMPQLCAAGTVRHAHSRLHRHWRSDRVHAGGGGGGSLATLSASTAII